MKIQLLPSQLQCGRPAAAAHSNKADTDPASQQFLTSYVIDERVVLDAGAIGFAPLAVQQRVTDLFISHTHIDHIASLPIFLDNVYSDTESCVRVHASSYVIEVLNRHFFNDQVWPDFVRLGCTVCPPFLKFIPLEKEKPVQVGNLTVLPVPVNHVVPTYGFLVDDGRASVAIVADTGPTERIWELANAKKSLAAVYLEASFPESMSWLAEEACHLTPKLFAAEIRKLDKKVPVHPVHIKAQYAEAVMSELRDLNCDQLQLLEPGEIRSYNPG